MSQGCPDLRETRKAVSGRVLSLSILSPTTNLEDLLSPTALQGDAHLYPDTTCTQTHTQNNSHAHEACTSLIFPALDT